MPTHGSLTKAGKVRNQTPKIEPDKKKKNVFPRKRNRANYRKRILYAQTPTLRGKKRK